MHGSKDEIVSPADALEFSKFIHNHQLHIIEDADHEYTSYQEELTSAVVEFVTTGLIQVNTMRNCSSILSRI